MSKIESYKQYIIPLIEAYFNSNDSQKLTNYFITNSNLPGPRANLELANAFADIVQEYSNGESENLWQLCSEFVNISAGEAPTNDPKEFIPFCGANGIGAIGSVSAEYFSDSLAKLKMLANDTRWRMREAVSFGLQRLLARQGIETLKELERWINVGALLELRTAAVAVAEPALLKDKQIANAALHLHKQIFERIRKTVTDRKAEGFRVLRKALGFTLSVIVCGNPEQGFEFMQNLIHSDDADLRWIVKENLKKNRLIKNYPEHVESIKAMLL